MNKYRIVETKAEYYIPQVRKFFIWWSIGHPRICKSDAQEVISNHKFEIHRLKFSKVVHQE